MRDNFGNNIRLVVGGFECDWWDDVTIDSQIDIPADAWNLTSFNNSGDILPSSIQGGTTARLYFADELILTGVVDQIVEHSDRSGHVLNLSGRDLSGQLIDCSSALLNAKTLNFEQFLKNKEIAEFFPLGELKIDLDPTLKSFNKKTVSVEPGESIWDAFVKLATSMGQWVWFDPDGTLRIGDPFASAYHVKTPLQLMYNGANNNVLSLEYNEDVTGVFNTIRALSQDDNGSQLSTELNTKTPYNFPRLKIITLPNIETQAELQAAIHKIQHDNDLEAYTLTATVAGWTIDSMCWQPGFEITVQTDVLPRANAKWVVMGRTLNLSRSSGKTTTLKLKRKGDWVQPLIYKEQTQAKKKKTSRQDTSLGLGDAERGIYDGDSQ